MSTVLKHKQRSHRSYYQNRRTMGSIEAASVNLTNSHYFMKNHDKFGFFEIIKRMFGMKRGEA